MLSTKIIDDLSNKIKEMSENSPAGEFKKNLHALIQGALTKMELISREEFDIQTEVLAKTREKLQILEKKLADLEKEANSK